MLIETVYDTGVGGAKWLFGAAHVLCALPTYEVHLQNNKRTRA